MSNEKIKHQQEEILSLTLDLNDASSVTRYLIALKVLRTLLTEN